MNNSPRARDRPIYSIERPDQTLWTYYLIRSVAFGPAFPIALLLGYLRFRSLRYRFDEEGVSMSWGILFRHEINLTYSRIQDIHLASNAIERWLNLARIEIQTASGSSKAEMTIEGIPQFEELRDFLYSRMRGARSMPMSNSPDASPEFLAPDESPRNVENLELVEVLREVTLEVRRIREVVESQGKDCK